MRSMHMILVLLGALLVAPALPTAAPIQITEVVWRDAPATLPPGTKMAVLEGDPKKEGLFTMRIKVPGGAKIAPHWHPRPERVTVLWGEARVGFGDKLDVKKTKNFPAGSYYVNPPESHHYLYFPRTTVLQMTGEGPWELHYLKE
jgi:quercetin dioxygenase-like cupin family protein